MILMILLFVFAIFSCIAFVVFVHYLASAIFSGNYVIIQTILELCANFFYGLFIGRILGRRLFYINLKNLYKKQEPKEKGEQK